MITDTQLETHQDARSSSSHVIVVGGGNAGLVAALAARDQGAQVILLEASSKETRGGNSRFSGALFRFAHEGRDSLVPLLSDDAQSVAFKVKVGAYSREDYNSDIQETSRGRTWDSLSRILIDQSYDTVAWMRDHGVPWEITIGKFVKDPSTISEDDPYPIPAGGIVRATGAGIGLVESLYVSAERAGVDIWYDSPVEDLILGNGVVLGVTGRRDQQPFELRGPVVLASGGFEANPEMRARYLGPGWDLVKVRGTALNTGHLLQRALAVGARAVGHWSGCHAAPVDASAPDVGDLAHTDETARYSYPYGLLVNVAGQRFVDESEDHYYKTYAKTGAAIREQPGGVAFQIFDQQTLHLLQPRYSTSKPVIANTIGELAEKLGVDARGLKATVEDFNASVLDSVPFGPLDLDGRSTAPGIHPRKSNWALRLDLAPFVAYPVACGITFTYGGVGITERAEVQRAFGGVIGGLYATGEISGGFFYHNYPAGSGLMRGAVFGRIAGREAAARLEAPLAPTALPTSLPAGNS